MVTKSTVLSSWKEIAAYLGKGVRTVQRWERDLGLPVRRPVDQSDRVVIALPAELDAWVRQQGRRVMPGATSMSVQQLHAQLARLHEMARQLNAKAQALVTATRRQLQNNGLSRHSRRGPGKMRPPEENGDPPAHATEPQAPLPPRK